MEASRHFANAVSLQRGLKTDKCVLGKENESGNKKFPKKPCFLDNYSQETRLKDFREPRDHIGTQDRLRHNSRHNFRQLSK